MNDTVKNVLGSAGVVALVAVAAYFYVTVANAAVTCATSK